MKVFAKSLGEYGTGIGSLLSWGISSLVLWISKKATRRSASATT